MNRFGVLDRLREHWLAAAGLAVALVALALAALPGSETPHTTVLVLRHAVAAGATVGRRDVVGVRIAASDRTPSMLGELGVLEGRRALIRLSGGDFLIRGALRADAGSPLLRPGERAVALELNPASAPDMRLLRAGRHVDVVIAEAAGSRVAARGLELLAPASERSGGIVVTVRAPAAVALALSGGGSGRDLRLLLRGDGS